ncbi:MAG TPA: sialidase family protein, partial [Anaeromyxobacter sp.]
ATWSAPVQVGRLLARGATDPKTGHAVRAGEVVPFAAVDPATGTLHVVWQDARFSGGARDGIAHSTSTNGGLVWSAPVQVNGAPGVQAFRPAVAVGDGGAIAVTYYDFRSDDALDSMHTWTTFWLATSTDGGATWRDVPVGGPFDLRSAPDVDGWFLGDYTGLVARRSGFVALFAMGGASTDVFASR